MEFFEGIAKLPKPADIKEFETIFIYLEHEGVTTKRDREGYNAWSDVDNLRAKKKADFIQTHLRLNTTSKIAEVK